MPPELREQGKVAATSIGCIDRQSSYVVRDHGHASVAGS
jgi:hypothetical protein